MLSHLYQNLPPFERGPIDREVDAMFRKETGYAAKLDWQNVRDKPHARTWLRIRDVVVGRYFLAKVRKLSADYSQNREQQVRYLAQTYQSNLAEEATKRGLPELEHGSLAGKIIETGHLAVEAFEISELAGVWEVMLGAHMAHTLTGVVGIYVAPLVNLAGGLYAIGHANEAGQRGAERNAFKWGFGETLAAMSDGRDWRPTLSRDTPWGEQQARGRAAAIRLLREMGKDVGLKFLQKYKGIAGKANALNDLGNYD